VVVCVLVVSFPFREREELRVWFYINKKQGNRPRFVNFKRRKTKKATKVADLKKELNLIFGPVI
jgi:hypothetical protein